MKKAITLITLVLTILFSTSLKSLAQTYYDVYLCDDATAKLHIDESNLEAGDVVHWFLNGNTAAEAAITYTGTAGSTDFTVPANLAAGLYQYTTRIESKSPYGCLGDESDPFSIYKLPNKTLALTKTIETYCAENSRPGQTSGSEVTATTTPAAPLPDGIGYEYTWSVTEDGNSVSPGTADDSNTATSVYSMTTTTAGTYVFNASVKYIKLTGNTGTLLPGTNNCEVQADATQTVVVTPKPSKPTISLAF